MIGVKIGTVAETPGPTSRFTAKTDVVQGMLTKTVLLEDLKSTLTYILCQDLADDERTDMLSSINAFMEANARRYSEEELLDHFDSAEKILDLFIDFLESRREMAGQTIH